MTREIKFRAWDNFKGQMKPVKGLSFDYCEEIGMKGDEIGVVYGEPFMDTLSIDKKNWKSLGVANHSAQGDTCILMQYTGLKDKNGKEIYEGDILKISIGGTEQTNPYIVEDMWSLRIGMETDDGYMRISPIFKIIGNIYENKDLLK